MLDRVEFDQNQVATIFFNGTGTKFQPEKYLGDYETIKEDKLKLSETLSYLATRVAQNPKNDHADPNFAEYVGLCEELKTTANHKTQPAYKDDQLEFLQCQIIAGPDTAGTKVYYLIALGVTSIIGNILCGKNIFNISGHSRGGVIANLVAWELDRIKQAMGNLSADATNAEIFNQLCGDQEENITAHDIQVRNQLRQILQQLGNKDSFLQSVQSRFSARDSSEINCREIWINLDILDPVPGNAPKNIYLFGYFINWIDPKMLLHPEIVRNVQTIYCINEDSGGFDPVYSEPVGEHTKITRYLMPGHHGTLVGNIYGNNCERPDNIPSFPEGMHTGDAQIITLYLLIESFKRHGTIFITEALPDRPYPLDAKYLQFIQEENPQERAKLKLAAYRGTRENMPAYKAMNNTVYTGLPWIPFHESFREPLHEAPNIRRVITGIYGERKQLRYLIKFNGTLFFDKHYLEVFMQVHFGLTFNENPEDLLSRIIDTDPKIQSLINREQQQDVVDEIADFIQTTVASLVISYIENNLSPGRKNDIINTIKKALLINIPENCPHHYSIVENLDDNSITNGIPTKLGSLKLALINKLETFIKDQIILQVSSLQACKLNLLETFRDLINEEITSDEKLSRTQSIIESLQVQYNEIMIFAQHLISLQKGLTIEAGDSINEHQKARIKNLQKLMVQQSRILQDEYISLPLLTANIVHQLSLPNIADTFAAHADDEFYIITHDFLRKISGDLQASDAENTQNRLLVGKINEKAEKKPGPTAISAQVLSIFIEVLGAGAIALALVLLATLALNIAIAPTIVSGTVGLGLLGFGMYRMHRDSKNAGRNEVAKEVLKEINESGVILS